RRRSLVLYSNWQEDDDLRHRTNRRTNCPVRWWHCLSVKPQLGLAGAVPWPGLQHARLWIEPIQYRPALHHVAARHRLRVSLLAAIGLRFIKTKSPLPVQRALFASE